MHPRACVDSLSMPLPEDILKRKWAGDLEGAIRAIDCRLKHELPDALRARLECEKERIRRLPTQYPYTREQALEKLRELVPSATEEQFDLWELEGRIDFIYIQGEKRYFIRALRSIALHPDLKRQAGREVTPVNDWLDPMIHEIKEKGSLSRRITMEASVYVEKEDFVPGEYLLHLPFPAVSAQQSDICLLSGDPDGIAPEDAPARTVYWRRKLSAWQEFAVRYAYVSTIRYADPLHQPRPAAPLYPNVAPPCADDLAEFGAFMRFTPYLTSLSQELAAGATTDVDKAWRYYEFVTTKVDYSYMRDYFQIDHINEFCAVNLRGDCGLQALLFILLCRIGGIPARWQSGLSISQDYAGSHDWAQFYVEGWGWLFADCSYGGSAYRHGSNERHQFFFGNLDPMRMVANRTFQAELTPELSVLRVDPYDNQSGEVECIGAALPFTMRQLDGRAELIGYETL
ncbi:MAG: transglutaminase-like domain-containing protein [Clostridiales bacterium]|nr:transglutaminase-like domain-containing protein [Clostridiales bacterium]